MKIYGRSFANNTYILICMYRPDSYCKAVICASMFSIPGEPLWLGLHTELMRALGDGIVISSNNSGVHFTYSFPSNFNPMRNLFLQSCNSMPSNTKKSVNVNTLVLLVTYLIFFAICGVVCVKLAHSSLGYREDIFITYIFITSEVFTFPIVVIFFHSCVPEVVVPSYAGSFIYILRNLGLCLLFCAVLWCVQIMKYIMVPWSYLFVCTLYYLIIIIMQTYLKAFNFYKSDGKRRNTLGCLDQYTRKVLRPWNSQDRETV